MTKQFPKGWLLPILIVLTAHLSRADSLSSVARFPSEKDLAASTITDQADLGTYADLHIPDGCRFLEVHAARALLDRMNNPATPGLLGILEPRNKSWLAVLKFDDIGYVKDPEPEALDLPAILKIIQDRHQNTNGPQQNTDPASVLWEIAPRYDNTAHSLEWAFRAETSSGKMINHTVALLGRRGALEIVLVQPARPSQAGSGLVPLDQFVRNISFKENQGYSDYQDGDILARAGLKELIVGDDPPADGQEHVATPLVPPIVTQLYLALGACVFGGIAWQFLRKLRKRKSRHEFGAAAPARTVAQSSGKKTGTAPSAHPEASHRRKVFDHARYYSDIILKLSGSTYASVGPTNAGPHTNGTIASQPAPSQLELVAFQRIVIEEQRRLLREQTWIIEEKTRLLKESRQLTEKWAEGA